MKTIAIQDANILIDLIRVDLFGHCLSLGYTFMTTDIIFAELHDEQQLTIQPHIDSEKFTVVTLTEDDLYNIYTAAMEDNKLSEQDWSALQIAEQRHGILLTGDKNLRVTAEAKGIKVCGILWILDELIDHGHLEEKTAAEFLQAIMAINSRLPLKECNLRLKSWKE